MCQEKNRPYKSKKPLKVYKSLLVGESVFSPYLCISLDFKWKYGKNQSSRIDKTITTETYNGFHFFLNKKDAMRDANFHSRLSINCENGLIPVVVKLILYPKEIVCIGKYVATYKKANHVMSGVVSTTCNLRTKYATTYNGKRIKIF